LGLSLLQAKGQAQEIPCTDAIGLVEMAAQRLGSEEALATGAAADVLVGEAVERACLRGGLSRWLSAVCGRPLGKGALLTLRRRLVVDVASLPEKLLPSTASLPLTDAERGARVGVALLRALLTQGNLAALARSLREGALVVPAWTPAQPCASSVRSATVASRRPVPGKALPPGEQGDPWLLGMVEVLERLARVEHLPEEEIFRELLRDVLPRAEPWLRQREREAQAVASAVRLLASQHRELRASPSPGHAVAVAEALATLAVTSSALAKGLDLPESEGGKPAAALALPEGWKRLLLRLLEGDLKGAAQAAPLVSGPTEIPGEVEGALRLLASVSQARDQTELTRGLRSWLLPWSEPWLFDASASWPRLAGNEQAITGRLALGYSARQGGVLLFGGVQAHNTVSGELLARNIDTRVEADLWWSWGGAGRSLELRGSGRFASLDTQTIVPTATGGNSLFLQERSLLGRGLLMAGARVEPGPRSALGLWLGLGGQYERYSSTEVLSSGHVNLKQDSTPGLILAARLSAQQTLWSSVLVARVRVDVERFSIQRNSLNIDLKEQLTLETEIEERQRMDLQSRFFLDAEIARIFGFVPGIGAGMDVVMQSEAPTSLVPSLAIGLRRTSF
jgi:hypothetical protein